LINNTGRNILFIGDNLQMVNILLKMLSGREGYSNNYLYD